MKVAKRFLIAALVLVLSGALIFVIGMSALKWDFYALDSAEYEAMTYAPEEGETVTKVTINVDSFPVTVKAGDSVSLDYYDSDDVNVSVKAEDGELKIVSEYKHKFIHVGLFDFKRSKLRYELTVPNGTLINMSGTNGTLKLENYKASEINIDCVNADLKLTDCEFTSMTVKSVNADLIFKRLTVGDATIESTNLDFDMRDASFGTLRSKSTNYTAWIYDAAFTELSLRSTNGNYELNNITVDNLGLKATNLNAKVRINGKREEYSVESSGRGLPSVCTGTTDKKITLSGTNCSVKLGFTE